MKECGYCVMKDFLCGEEIEILREVNIIFVV